ncbi:conserved protein of unknown function [Ectopseudomonas oleovorans]|uniref:Uncharacterized protein n=1 Tax=Ectopseudomonas oleovorans TaxID=301 RepID=A0A653B613_ECTOL|nr:conserved protein of unknown function [Pseudomonas oleovorans]
MARRADRAGARSGRLRHFLRGWRVAPALREGAAAMRSDVGESRLKPLLPGVSLAGSGGLHPPYLRLQGVAVGGASAATCAAKATLRGITLSRACRCSARPS